MTLKQLRAMSRLLIPGLKESVFATSSGDANLDLIINAGVLDIASYTACLKANKKFNVVSGQAEYSISSNVSDFLVIDKPGLWWNTGTVAAPHWKRVYPRTLKWLDENRPNWRAFAAGNPADYSLDGDILTLVPKPATSLSGGLWIYYGKTPDTMTSEGQYPFGGAKHYPYLDIFDEAIISYVRWKTLPALNKVDEYLREENSYRKLRSEKFAMFNRRPDIQAEGILKGSNG